MILASCTGMLTLVGCVQRHVHVHTTADHDHTNLVQACASGVVFGGGSTELVVIQIQCVNLCTGAFDTFDSWTPDSGILGTVLQHKVHVGGRSGIQGQDTVSHFVRMLSCRVSSSTACCAPGTAHSHPVNQNGYTSSKHAHESTGNFHILCENLARGRPGQPKIRPGTADPKTRKFNYKNVIFELGFGFRTPPPIPDPKIAKT